MKLKPKLVLAFLLTALIPVAVIGYLSYSSAKAALQRQALEDLTLVAEAKEWVLYHFFEMAKDRAMELSSDGFIRNSAEAMQKLDPKGPRYTGLQKALSMYLKHNKMHHDMGIYLILVTDMKGRVIAATEEGEIGADESEDEYFLQGGKGVYISDMYIPPRPTEGKRPYIAAAAPLTDKKTGNPLGVIINFYYHDELRKMLSGEYQIEKGAISGTLGRRETLDIYLVNKEKLLITPSRFSSELMKQRVETLPVLECAAGRETSGIYRNYLGREVIGASMCIPGRGWTLLTEIETREAFAPVESLRKRVIALGVAIALLASILAYLIAHGISRPVVALSKATQGLAGGDFSVRAPVESKDEIGDLASSFNRMASQLAESQEERAFLANITEHAADAIVGLDLNTNIVSWNRGAEMIFGYQAKEVIGKPWSMVVPHEAQDACRERFKKATFEGLVKTAETLRVAKDGRRFPAEMTLTSLKNEKGEHIGFVTITRDITERKNLEDQLRHAQKLEAIGILAGGIAHDFNNILNAIIGFGNLIEMDMKGDDPNRAYLKEILSAGERAAHLTKSLLAFSRKQIISPKSENLNEILRSVGKFLRRIIGEDIELKTILNPSLPLFDPSVSPLGKGGIERGVGDLTVIVDRGQIEQVLMNLATNARDAMPNGGELIIETGITEMDEEYVKMHGYGEPGIYALISITDSGIGMDEETRKRIFEPFFTTKEMGRGTGLGLAMVYGIVKQHDGYINVYSEPGKGTTFKIYLPLIKSEAGEAVSAAPAVYTGGGTETVLVAEDDQAVRKLTRDVLERFGYKVIAAEDGEDAIKKFMNNKEDIQLLLLDVIMPKKNGKEVYEEIKKINPRIKVLFLSGYTANLIHKKGILDEGLDFILKPVSPKELLRKVRRVLD
ncbi:MAG: MEKHLA domain-containing protein [Nitrospirae bacterium]|nr:MEKHLA domain-containing protein [Nitrospirota bacterium]MCL5421161.1 MEKHLA domain-containing protein [Nitrospirota bacterium]